jgi:hypothetical protein
VDAAGRHEGIRQLQARRARVDGGRAQEVEVVEAEPLQQREDVVVLHEVRDVGSEQAPHGRHPDELGDQRGGEGERVEHDDVGAPGPGEGEQIVDHRLGDLAVECQPRRSRPRTLRPPRLEDGAQRPGGLVLQPPQRPVDVHQIGVVEVADEMVGHAVDRRGIGRFTGCRTAPFEQFPALAVRGGDVDVVSDRGAGQAGGAHRG